MKNIISILSIIMTPLSFAQVIIGDETGTAINKSSVLLEFANTGDKGLVLPYLRVLPTSPSEGTIILDASVATAARIKYYNGSWIDLSGQDADVSDDLIQQPIIPENASSKVIIGNQNSTADGILVLESSTKAMVLPIVDSTNKIINPSPGMMVYLINGNKKRLAVFNGNKWSFWKP